MEIRGGSICKPNLNRKHTLDDVRNAEDRNIFHARNIFSSFFLPERQKEKLTFLFGLVVEL